MVRRPGKAGLASAYRAGFSWGLERGYEVLVGMDADLSHDATALPRLLGALSEGADVVVGSRYVPGGSTVDWPLGRRALSRCGNWYAAHVLGSGVADLTSAFRAYRATTLSTVDFDALKAQGYGWLIELAYQLERSGAKFAEFPVPVHQPGRRAVEDVAEDRRRVPEGGYAAGPVRAPPPGCRALTRDCTWRSSARATRSRAVSRRTFVLKAA